MKCSVRRAQIGVMKKIGITNAETKYTKPKLEYCSFCLKVKPICLKGLSQNSIRKESAAHCLRCLYTFRMSIGAVPLVKG